MNVNGGDVTASYINVGESGIGNVVVNNGGSIKSAGLTTVNSGSRIDVDSGALYVGSNSTATEGFLTIGLTVNGGIVNVNSTASTTVGGTLDLTNHATFNYSGNFYLHPLGELTLTNNATLNNSGQNFNVGSSSGSGTARLNVASGSVVTNTSLKIAGVSGSTGIVSNLFITYQGFDSANGIGLYTSAVPEPGSFVFFALASLAFTVQRRRRGA